MTWLEKQVAELQSALSVLSEGVENRERCLMKTIDDLREERSGLSARIDRLEENNAALRARLEAWEQWDRVEPPDYEALGCPETTVGRADLDEVAWVAAFSSRYFGYLGARG